jgi:hypothetical protein
MGWPPRLLGPQFVKPCIKGNKNGVAGAEAICEVVTRSPGSDGLDGSYHSGQLKRLRTTT